MIHLGKQNMIHGDYTITTRKEGSDWIATIKRTDGRQFTTFPDHSIRYDSIDTKRHYNEEGAIEEAKTGINGGGMTPC